MCKAYENMLQKNQASLIIVAKDGEFYFSGNGIRPLYDNMDKVCGNEVYDKAVGTAAAAIFAKAKPASVFTPIISQRGYEILQSAGIQTRFVKKVDYILNKRKDGLCPLEQRYLGKPSLDLQIIEDFLADIDKKALTDIKA